MYRTIDTRLWSDPKVRQLPPSGKLLFTYLITNPHTHLGGIYHLPPLYCAHDTGLSLSELDALWDTLWDATSGVGLARFDRSTDVVWVINMLRYQAAGEKAERSVANHLASLHNSVLINDFLKAYPAVRRRLKHRVSHPPSDRGSRVGLQEQEQEQEQKKNTKAPPIPPAGGSPEPPPSRRSGPPPDLLGKGPIQFDPGGRTFVGITAADHKAWGVAYPAVDVERQLAQMAAWIVANPAKGRKENYASFITRWLSRDQDRGGSKEDLAHGGRNGQYPGRMGRLGRVEPGPGDLAGIGKTVGEEPAAPSA